MKFIESLHSLFSRRISEDERRIQAQTEYRRQERNFQRYAAELDKAIVRFKQMAYEAHMKNQTDNALKCAAFTTKLTNTREKVDSVLQRFEMLQAMKNISDMMLQFMDSCSQIGFDLNQRIDIKALTSGQLQMSEGLNKLDYLSEQLEDVFNSIDDSFGLTNLSGNESADPAAVKTLNNIVSEFGGKVAIEDAKPLVTAASPISVASPVSADAPAVQQSDDMRSEISNIGNRLKALQH